MLLAALQGCISHLSAILTANISTDISTEVPYKKILYSTDMGGLLKPPRTTNKSVDILSNKLIAVLKNVEITSWKVRAYGIFTRVCEVSEIERVSAANKRDF